MILLLKELLLGNEYCNFCIELKKITLSFIMIYFLDKSFNT